MNLPIVVFDFDGVICDTTDECLVTSWNAWETWNKRDCNRNKLVDFSDKERNDFRKLRPYVKGAGEYYIIMKCLKEGKKIENPSDYEMYYKKYEPILNSFKAYIFQARENLRNNNLNDWINLNHVWPEITSIIKQLVRENRVYIATLKDRKSVISIFENIGINFPSENIFDQGLINTKTEALEIIHNDTRAQRSDIILFDDNVTHLIEPKSLGFLTFLTNWGPVINGYLDVAKSNNIPIVGLEMIRLITTKRN